MSARSRNLFSVHIANLNSDTDENELAELFSEAGKVVNTFIQTPGNGTSMTYGFVRYRTYEEAELAIDLLNNWPLNGSPLRVSFARDQPLKKNCDAETRDRRPAVNTPQTEDKYNEKNIEMLKSTMLKYGLDEDIPLFIEELKQVEYGEAPVFRDEHSDIDLNLKAIDALIGECNGPSIKTPAIGRLYSQTTNLPTSTNNNETDKVEPSILHSVDSDNNFEPNLKSESATQKPKNESDTQKHMNEYTTEKPKNKSVSQKPMNESVTQKPMNESVTQKPGVGRGKISSLRANIERTSSSDENNSDSKQGSLKPSPKHREGATQIHKNESVTQKPMNESVTQKPGVGRGKIWSLCPNIERTSSSDENNSDSKQVSLKPSPKHIEGEQVKSKLPVVQNSVEINHTDNAMQSLNSKTTSFKPLGRGKGLLKLLNVNSVKYNSNNNNSNTVQESDSLSHSSVFEDAENTDETFTNLVKNVPKDSLPSMPSVSVQSFNLQDDSILGVQPVGTKLRKS